MVYVEKWSGGFSGGIAGGGRRSGSSSGSGSGDQCMRPASPLIEREEPSGASFMLIF